MIPTRARGLSPHGDSPHREPQPDGVLVEAVLAGAGALAVVLVAVGALPPALLAVAAVAILNAFALG